MPCLGVSCARRDGCGLGRHLCSSPMIFATLDEYISAAGISKERKEPLFRTTRGRRRLTGNPLLPSDLWRMIRRRAATASIKTEIVAFGLRGSNKSAFLSVAMTCRRLVIWTSSPWRKRCSTFLKLYRRSRSEVVFMRYTLASHSWLNDRPATQAKHVGRFWASIETGTG